LPEPESPVKTTSLSRGMRRSTFFRLCSRAPRIEMRRSSNLGASKASCGAAAFLASAVDFLGPAMESFDLADGERDAAAWPLPLPRGGSGIHRRPGAKNGRSGPARPAHARGTLDPSRAPLTRPRARGPRLRASVPGLRSPALSLSGGVRLLGQARFLYPIAAIPAPAPPLPVCAPTTLCYNTQMSNPPANAALDRTPQTARPAPARDALGASALERLAPALGALLCLWGLVFWALR